MEEETIFDYVLAEENSYKTRDIPIADNWEWSMAKHIRLSMFYKYGRLDTGNQDDKPVKNIIWPILNVAYRSEGFDVKDIEPFVNDEQNYHKSFFTRKFHDKWARKNDIDTFIDEVVESSVDYDLVLVKNVNDKRPEVVPLQGIAFCDQTDILSGPIGLKHMYSPDQLMDMAEEAGWDADAIEKTIVLSRTEKANNQTQSQKAKTPGKYIEVYEVHGTFPEKWLSDKYPEYDASKKYCKQIHIITYYKDNQDKKQGICLFKGKEKKSIFKALVVNKIFGRACGYGGVEALFEDQVWTTYSMIQVKKMLDASALMLLHTTDPAFRGKNRQAELSKNEIMVTADNTTLSQVNVQPINMVVFDNFMKELEAHARITGSANDAQLGITPTSGTPLGTTQIVTGQGMGIHEYRKGKIATFLGEIYRDWVLDYLVADMNKGDKWIEELSIEEMQEIAEKVATNESNKRIKDLILKGDTVTPEMQTMMKDLIKQEFKKGGSKKFLQVFKDEMKNLPVDVYVNIAGKQKNLSQMTDKITNIFRFIFSNPQGFAQAMQMPGMQKAWNEILEFSGISPIDFSGFSPIPSPIQPQLEANNTPNEIPVQ